jgi:hypothetical protein
MPARTCLLGHTGERLAEDEQDVAGPGVAGVLELTARSGSLKESSRHEISCDPQARITDACSLTRSL